METLNKIKKESVSVLILFIILTITFKILFYKENLLVILKTVMSIFWLFVLPGFSIMYYWQDKLDFIERIIIGTALGAAINGVIGYNLGLLGIHMKYQLVIVPLACLVTGGYLIYLKIRNK